MKKAFTFLALTSLFLLPLAGTPHLNPFLEKIGASHVEAIAA